LFDDRWIVGFRQFVARRFLAHGCFKGSIRGLVAWVGGGFVEFVEIGVRSEGLPPYTNPHEVLHG
jgi:hypothetical protein